MALVSLATSLATPLVTSLVTSVAAEPPQVSAARARRGIIFSPQGPSNSTTSSNGTFDGSNSTATAISASTSSISTSSTPTPSSNNATTYIISTDHSSHGSSNLRYLFLIFLVLGLAVVVVVARWFLVKRHRKRRQRTRDIVRTEALRRDLESSGSMQETTRTDSTGIRRPPAEEDGWVPPPPPYEEPPGIQAERDEFFIPAHHEPARPKPALSKPPRPPKPPRPAASNPHLDLGIDRDDEEFDFEPDSGASGSNSSGIQDRSSKSSQ